jgi:splicing factor 3B subunit 3
VADKLGTAFHQTSVPLKYTPRRVAVHPTYNHLVVIETEHRSFSPAERARRLQGGAAASATAAPAGTGTAIGSVALNEREEDDMETDEGPSAAPSGAGGAGSSSSSSKPVAADGGGAAGEERVDEYEVRAPEATWASCVRIIDPIKAAAYSCVDLADNEAAFWCVGL